MLKNISISGGIGLIIGIFLVWWVRPDNDGGTAILIAGSIVVVTVLGSIISGIAKRRRV
ncbi:hypothetical protein ACCS37_32395 [Rhizobium ruizarguesonis]